MLDHILQFKGEAKGVNKNINEYNLYLRAQKLSGLDSYLVLNNLPRWWTAVNLIKNRSSIVSLKNFNGYIDQLKKLPQYVHFRCGFLPPKGFLKKIGKSYKLQPRLLKQEVEHDEIYDVNWEKENMNG